MKKLKYLICALLIGALLLPYTAFAAENTSYGYGEGVVRDPFETSVNDGFSLAAASSQLSEKEKGLINYIVSKIPELSARIEIPEKYQLSEERFAELYINYMGSLLQFEHPEIFYLSGAFGYVYKLDSQHTVTSLSLGYKSEYSYGPLIRADKIRNAQAAIENEINNIAAGTEGMTDLEKALYVHDYIASNYEYDTRVYSTEEGVDGNRTLDKMVEEKTGVCQGYTYLYMTAMQKLGIECVAVPSDELHHVWNKIKLDGEWYNVDITYDDPIVTNMAAVSHRYFLVNDEEIKALDPDPGSCHTVWNTTKWDGEAVEVSTSGKYSYSPLHSMVGPTAYTDGKFYCFDPYNNLCEVIFENGQQILREQYVLSRDYRWFGHGQHSGYYTSGVYEGLPYYSSTVAVLNGKIYFNSPNAVYQFISKDTVEEIYKYDGTPDASDTYFYGLRVINNGLYVEYSEGPYEEVTLIGVPVSSEPEATDKPAETATPAPTAEPTPEPTAQPTAEPIAEPVAEVFPEFEEPLPVEKPEVVHTEITDVTTDEETGEEITSYEVTLSVDIPEEVHEAANEARKPVKVSIAKYNEFGGFIGFEIVEVDENNQAKFEADSTCDIIKMFIWSGFIMPLSEPGEYQLGQITE